MRLAASSPPLHPKPALRAERAKLVRLSSKRSCCDGLCTPGADANVPLGVRRPVQPKIRSHWHALWVLLLVNLGGFCCICLTYAFNGEYMIYATAAGGNPKDIRYWLVRHRTAWWCL